jgi:plastocyanin
VDRRFVMRMAATKLGCCFLVLLVTVVACARIQKTPAVVQPGGPLIMKIASYSFDPNYIRARQGDTLTINLQNVSGSEHNLTIKNPEGKTIVSQDVTAGSTAMVKVELPAQGGYDFYCDKTGHSTLGMKGRIEVAAR